MNCPVCAANCANDPLYTYTVAQAAAHFVPVTRNAELHQRMRDSLTRLWRGDHCFIRRCQECGFGFADPFVGGDEEFYEVLHHHTGYPAWKWDYDVGLEQARAYPNGGAVLDVGAGSGQFLSRLDGTWSKHATEGSDITRAPLRKAGISVFNDLSDAVRIGAGTFELVTAFQVLEHLSQFQVVLAHCRQLLKPGGRLLIVVPDGDAMIRQEQVTGCADMPPNHVCKWTPSSLRLAMTNAEFTVGQTVEQPASLTALKGLLHLKLKADACETGSLAAQAYRLSSRPARAGVLGVLALGAAARMAPHIRHLPLSGAFAMVGHA